MTAPAPHKADGNGNACGIVLLLLALGMAGVALVLIWQGGMPA